MSPEQIQLTDQRTSPGGPGEKKQEPASGSTQEEIEGLWARYTPGEKKIIEKAIAAVASTRRTGRLAPSVVLAILAKLARYPAAVVAGACSVFVERGYAAEGKREGYLLGIARGEARRQEAITRPPAAPAPVEKIPRGYTPEAWAREKALREKMAKWY